MIKLIASLVLALLFVVLAGCSTKYEVKRCEVNGVCSEAYISSRREFEQVSVEYDRESGTFHFSAGKATTSVSPLENAGAALLMQLPDLVRKAQE